MKTNEIKNEIDETRKKLNKKIYYIKEINVNMIFNNMKRKDLLLKVFILVKLIQIKLK